MGLPLDAFASASLAASTAFVPVTPPPEGAEDPPLGDERAQGRGFDDYLSDEDRAAESDGDSFDLSYDVRARTRVRSTRYAFSRPHSRGMASESILISSSRESPRVFLRGHPFP